MSKLGFKRMFTDSTFSIIPIDSYMFSAYLPGSMRHTLLKIRPSDYILCPVYTKDFQIGFTGGSIKDESLRDTFIRELGEEMGLKPRNPNMNLQPVSSSPTFASFIVNIAELTPLTE